MDLSLSLRSFSLLFLEVLLPILTKQIVPLTHGSVTPVAQHAAQSDLQSDLWWNRQSIGHPVCQLTSVPPLCWPYCYVMVSGLHS